jgi:hypothetical protein
MYVITNPATILAIALDEPNENNIPINTETPWNAGEPEPGRYGKISTSINAYNSNFKILKVGCAQSA